MTTLAFFSIAPLGEGPSVGDAVARALDLVDRSGLPYRLGPMGTVVEGTYDEVLALIGRCHATLAAEHERVSLLVKIDTRAGDEPRIDAKVARVEERLDRPLT